MNHLDALSAAARKYRPQDMKILLVAESPPQNTARYFYFEHVREHDSLFRYVSRSLTRIEPTRENKSLLLGKLSSTGVFLIDLKPDPFSRMSLKDCVPDLIARCKALRPGRIILIKATVYDAAYESLRAAGLPVVNVRVPFPGSGQQRRFEIEFAKALAAN